MHVGFKVAAKMGSRYINMLEQHEDRVAENVTRNLFDRHIRPVFLGTTQTDAATKAEIERH
jgi:hypothetical protein